MGDLTIRNKSSVNYIKSGESMPYVVKSVRGYKYVYRQFRVGDKIITEYIGPLDKIVDHYLKTKDWCGGRDSNPGRPTPTEPQSVPYSQAVAAF